MFTQFSLVMDDRCQASVKGKVVWKCNHLLELLDKPDILMDEHEYTPQTKSDGFIMLGGWEFNISSTIHVTATSDDVIKGWNMFNDDMGHDIVNRLFQPFFYRTVIEANSYPIHQLRNKEPEIIELLRLSYWYHKNSQIARNTFAHKRKEIRGKLGRKLLQHVEKYKTTVKDEEFIPDMNEFREKLKRALIKAKEGKSQDNEFDKYMTEMPKAIYGVTSELIFAGLSGDAGYAVSFETSGKGYDYDFIVNNIPCQVKTILVQDHRQQIKIDNRINELRSGKQIELEEVKNEIICLIHENKNDIKKAIEQGGRIMCINGTQTYAGFLLNQWASDNSSNLIINKALQTSINLLLDESNSSLPKKEEKLLPVIFGATGIDYAYRFSSWSFKVAINLTLDDPRIVLIDGI